MGREENNIVACSIEPAGNVLWAILSFYRKGAISGKGGVKKLTMLLFPNKLHCVSVMPVSEPTCGRTTMAESSEKATTVNQDTSWGSCTRSRSIIHSFMPFLRHPQCRLTISARASVQGGIIPSGLSEPDKLQI